MLKKTHQKRPLSLTSLVDVIFLLLLFFMLTSTFSKFAEVELMAASGGGAPSDVPPIFMQLFEDRVTLAGTQVELDSLSLEAEPGQTLLLSMQNGVSAQRLTDALVALRAFPDVSVAVIGGAS
ncbi:MAG: biopolymer transporter ExbD [Pseudomonadota bacterium]